MYTFLFFFAIFGALAYAFYSTFIKSHRNYEQQKTTEQPTHFDLLDDNGDPIPSSDDRSRASAPHPIHEPSVQHLRYFSIKDKGYHVSVWPKDHDQFDIVEFNIAGISHHDNVDNYLGEFKGILEEEPTNKYDPNAIKILAADGHHVGYVPKDMTKEVRDNAQLPHTCFCYVGSKDGKYYTDCYVIRKN